MPTYTVEVTDVEDRAFRWRFADPQQWVTNAVMERVRNCVEMMVKEETERLMNDSSVDTIPADKNTLIMNSTLLSASERAELPPE